MMSAAKIIETAKLRLIVNQKMSFFGALSGYLKTQETTSLPTAATDGFHLYYNPEFIKKIFLEGAGGNESNQTGGLRMVMGVIVHEILHVALSHLWRRKSREGTLWNCACDYAINLIVIDSDLTLPEKCLLDKEYRGMTAEEIYAKLLAEQKDKQEMMEKLLDDHSLWEKGNPGENGEGEGNGDSSEARSFAKMDDSSKEAEWKNRVAAAAQNAKGRGELPAGIKQLIDSIMESTIPWEHALIDYMTSSRNRYTFNPFDRRFISEETYLPDLGGREYQEIVVAIDTSGSTGGYLEKFAAEVTSILNLQGRTTVHLICCDTEINIFKTLEEGEDWPQFNFAGGGGTYLTPVFKEVEKRGIQPAVMVFLTDGECETIHENPEYPVLWVLTPDGTNPPCNFGKCVKIT